jgi:hypothetical protein
MSSAFGRVTNIVAERSLPDAERIVNIQLVNMYKFSSEYTPSPDS